MQRAAFGGGDHERGGARLLRAGQFDDIGGIERARGQLHGLARLRAGSG